MREARHGALAAHVRSAHALSTTLWPWLRQFGLARLPGDLAVDFIPGLSFHLPITTSLLISGVIAGVWALFIADRIIWPGPNRPGETPWPSR